MAMLPHRKQTPTLLWRHPPSNNAPLCVLIVDDNEEAAEALSAYLDLEGMRCHLAFGGAQAVVSAIQWLPDLIVMDVSMPEISGVDAARMLRQNHQTEDITILAFTALDRLDVERRMGDHEFDGYCQKGNPPSVLVALINTRAGSGRQ